MLLSGRRRSAWVSRLGRVVLLVVQEHDARGARALGPRAGLAVLLLLAGEGHERAATAGVVVPAPGDERLDALLDPLDDGRGAIAVVLHGVKRAGARAAVEHHGARDDAHHGGLVQAHLGVQVVGFQPGLVPGLVRAVTRL